MAVNRMDTILDYWFHGVDDATAIDKDALPFKKWFIKNAKTDEEIRRQFEADLLKAAEGGYKDWEDSAKGRLALILLYDQFSRNMYRDTKKMYAYDASALELTLCTIKERKDHDLTLIQRAFLYMPLMHSEARKMQQLSVECFTKLTEESKSKNPVNTYYYEYTLKYAQGHYDSVAQFGRFPHRDTILKRAVKAEN